MKKIVLFLACIYCTTSYAQELKIAPVFGPNVTVSNYSKASKNDFKNSVGTIDGKSNFPPSFRFQFGLLADYSLTKALGLQSGLLVSYKGLHIKYSGKSSGVEAKVSSKQTFTYLELPLWATYRIGDGSVKIVGGPVIGLALGIKQSTTVSGGGNKESGTIKGAIGTDPVVDDLRPIDISFNLGVAKEIEVAERPLELSLNLQPSLTKWNPSSKLDSSRFGRHFVVGLRAAYYFQIN